MFLIKPRRKPVSGREFAEYVLLGKFLMDFKTIINVMGAVNWYTEKGSIVVIEHELPSLRKARSAAFSALQSCTLHTPLTIEIDDFDHEYSKLKLAPDLDKGYCEQELGKLVAACANSY